MNQTTLLDAGRELRIGETPLPMRVASGIYGAALGGESPEYGLRPMKLFFRHQSYSVRWPGGKDIGPAAISILAGSKLEWTNRAGIDIVHRARGVLIRWRSTPGSRVLVLALNTNEATGALGLALCAASPNATSFHIPAVALATGLRSTPSPSSTSPSLPSSPAFSAPRSPFATIFT